nr:xanthine dehydrogenase family protein molybdopterin-binding subunit [Acuticoccus mangrovi]
MPRIEDARLLTGGARFVADLARHDLLHAVIVRSPLAHGRILAVDADAARAMDGVVALFTAADIGEVPLIPIRQHGVPEGEAYRQPVIAADRVRYVGEPVAIVVAREAAVAEDAAEAVVVDIDPLPVVADTAISARDETLVFAAPTNRVTTFRARAGGADAAFAAAPYTRRARFAVQRHTASPMETRGLLAEWDGESGHLTVHGATKVPFFNRDTLATMLGLGAGDVTLIEVDVGGGFGARGEFYPEDFLIPFAARRLGARVRWLEDRREHFSAMNHAREMTAEMEIACERDGRVIGIRGTVDVDLGAYVRTNGLTTPRNVAQFVTGPYLVPHIAIDVAVHVTNKTPTGTYRGPGRYEASFFCERLFDMAARDLGVDRAEFRMMNLIPEERLPYPLAHMDGLDASWQTELDNGAYGEVMARCLETFDWAAKSRLDGRLVDGRHHGIAVGAFVEGGAGGRGETARMTITADGMVEVAVGSTSLGQGLVTILTQIAADALSLPMDRIRLVHGSTNLVSQGGGSFHSRSTVMGGSAILLAAEALLQAIGEAAPHHEAAGKVRIEDGMVAVGDARLPLDAFAGLVVERQFFNKKLTYSYGAHAAHVSVDPRTGDVAVLDYVTVDDVGRVINPLTLHGQVVGALVQGLGSTFLEEIRYDEEGQLLTGSFADYLMPTATEVPPVRAISLGLRPCPNNPIGAKGAGEGGLIPVGGVIANAVAAALADFAVEPNTLPLTPPRLWHLIEAGRRAASDTTNADDPTNAEARP